MKFKFANWYINEKLQALFSIIKLNLISESIQRIT